MTEPKTKAEGPLSVGARTYIRELAAQEIFGVDFIVSSKAMEKGIEVEEDSIRLLNSVRGLSLAKNTERRHNDFIIGECDLFNAPRRRGHDVKSSWSIATFPIAEKDCEDKLYEWQMRGYMALWDAEEWEVNYCLVDTPDRLISFEPMQLHFVSNIPEWMRVTTWTVKRDLEKEAAIFEKVKHAREYFNEVIQEFDRTHNKEKTSMTENNNDQATVSQNGASSPPEFPAVLSPAEAVAPEPAPSAVLPATGAASVIRADAWSLVYDEIDCALTGMNLDELKQVAHFIDRLQSLRKAA